MKYSIVVELDGNQKNNHYCVHFYKRATHCFSSNMTISANFEYDTSFL